MNRNFPFLLLPLLVELLLYLCNDYVASGESCSWSGSNSAADPSLVTSVNLTCTYGRVNWYRPSGGILVLHIRPYFLLGATPSSSYSWTACIRKIPDPVPVSGTTIKDGQMKKGIACYYISNGGESISIPIRSSPVSRDNAKRVVIYYTAFPSGYAPAFYEYDASGVQKCAPCTEERIIDSYCQSDLVFTGRLREFFAVDTISFAVDDLQRRPFDPGTVFEKIGAGELTATLVARKRCFTDRKRGIVSNQEPEHHPPTYFVIAKTELGQAYLICALLLSDWTKIKRQILSDDDSTKDVLCDVR